MSKTIGEIIRELRCSRNLTQEQLAENLNITAQTVSKWENSIGMPDISQVVPLSHFFGVSTDTLFGLDKDNAEDKVMTYIEKATSAESFMDEYLVLKNALKEYPGDMRLLSELLSCGVSLISDGDYVSGNERSSIFEECERAGKLIMTYHKSPCTLMDTAGWLIRLYCEMGLADKAAHLCELLPINIGFNKYAALARVYETEGKFHEASSLLTENHFIFQGQAIHSLVIAGDMCMLSNDKEQAKSFFSSAVSIGEAFLETSLAHNNESAMRKITKSVELCRKRSASLSS